jgi:transcriptional regulator of met regulon
MSLLPPLAGWQRQGVYVCDLSLTSRKHENMKKVVISYTLAVLIFVMTTKKNRDKIFA